MDSISAFECNSLRTVWLCLTRNESRKLAVTVRGLLVIIYILLVFIYGGSTLLNPTWAESVTNFMHSALNESFMKNWFISDTGYLLLAPRMITAVTYKVLRCSPFVGLFVIQLVAYVIIGIVLSFLHHIHFGFLLT